MQESKFKHQQHFSSSNGGSGNKVGEQSVVGSSNTKNNGQAVLSPLTTPDSSNEPRANGTENGMNNGKEDKEIKDTKESKENKTYHKAKQRRSYQTVQDAMSNHQCCKSAESTIKREDRICE